MKEKGNIYEIQRHPTTAVLSFQEGGHIVALIEVAEVGSTVHEHILANLNQQCIQASAPESAEVRGEL